MSLNDKYIINGSTLSDIGDALRSVLGEKTEKTAEVVYCSRGISKSFGPTSATSTITASDISSSLRNIEDKFTKYVRAKLTSSSGSSPIIQQTPIQENIKRATWISSGDTTYIKGNRKLINIFLYRSLLNYWGRP